MSALPHDQTSGTPFDLFRDGAWPMQRTRTTRLLAALFVVLAAIPLFIGLDRQDIRNDEAIYTYASQHMAERGDWLTPRYVATIATDGEFLEKPPLKFWIVAGAIRLGLIRGDEFSIRLVDATIGAVAFAYIMMLGWRLGGVVCGSVALLLLVSFHPLLFSHGLRENEMEGALFLSYAAGLFHVAAWGSGGEAVRRRRHALAAALFFVLGFMTKFVAALFLPAVALTSLLVSAGGRRYLSAHGKDWLMPIVVAALLIAPWFAYQTVRQPGEFWAIILGGQVYDRFTTFVDPAHVQPWYFYVADTWRYLQAGDSQVAIAAGLAFAVWRAWRGDAAARLLLIWWAGPWLLISLGTSKVIHYTFPFLPPLALATGWMCAEVARVLDGRAPRPLAAVRRLVPDRLLIQGPRSRRVAALVAAIALALAAVTYCTGGPVVASLGGVRIFRNSSVLRPLVASVVLLLLSGYSRTAVRVASAFFLVVIVPVQGWAQAVELAWTFDRPMAAVRDCLHDLDQVRPNLHRGVYLSDPRNPELAIHPLFYYFRQAGTWVSGMDRYDTEIAKRLGGVDTQTPVLLSNAQWRAERAARWPGSRASGVADVDAPPDAIRISTGVTLVLPGTYASCVAPALAAGGRLFAEAPAE